MSGPRTITVDKRKSFATRQRESMRTMFTATEAGTLHDYLKDHLRKVTVDGVEFYVAEGDTLLDVDQLWFYALSRQLAEQTAAERNLVALGGMGMARLLQPPAQPSGLLGMLDEEGNFIRWPSETVLTYCVLKKTFAGEPSVAHAHYKLVVAKMRDATQAWQDTCNIRFEYREGLDESDSLRPPGVVFPVRELNTNGALIAAAFFPNDPVERRRVVIDPSYYSPTLRFDKVGVLRHELGHVLGFRHEHIRSGAPATCPGEDTANTLPLGDYDPKSVMHYFCGGVGSAELAITELDVAGAQRLYGPPQGAPAGFAGIAEAFAGGALEPLPTAFIRE